MYADFEFYSGPYGGSLISSDAFAALARRASLFIDQLTYNRLNQGWAVTDSVKMATCAVAETIDQYQIAAAQAVTAASLKSESVGSWSVAYQDPGVSREALNSAISDAARPYLLCTGLMDRSVYV